MNAPGVALLLFLNRFFPRPVHPFNLETGGSMTYAQWQFQQGHRTIHYYLDFAGIDEMFSDRKVLDVGCGAGGKTCYYATLKPRHVWGIDSVESYRRRATDFSREEGLAHLTSFVTGDAGDMPFSDEFFDTIILNDTVEHLSEPVKVLRQCLRVLRPGGRVFINFPPYYHPYGAHLSDAIGIPWVHLLFSEPTLVEAYRRLVSDLPDGEDRLNLRLGDRESDQLVYLNRMTARRFRRIARGLPAQLLHYREVPLRRYLFPLARIPGLKECFIRMVVAVLTPDR
ncbi:MAG: class I SAM-dependent methyltransferase [Bacillota bacterium]